MGSIRNAPCDWPLATLECEALTDLDPGEEDPAPDPEDPAPVTGDDLREMAVAFLWNWTGRQFGLCEITLRPCRRDCPEAGSLYYGTSGYPGRGGPWSPVLIGGEWMNLSCGRCRDRCGCDSPSTLRIPGPVDSIDEIRIDGEVLDEGAYRVDNRGTLIRTDGGSWPLCQDIGKPAGEDGTWSVTYTRGVPVPKGGQVAAAVFACELAKAVTKPNECKLPQRIQTITREGVTVGFLDSFEGIERGQTGVWMIDSWVASVTRRPKRTRVLSPDTMGHRVRTDGPVS